MYPRIKNYIPQDLATILGTTGSGTTGFRTLYTTGSDGPKLTRTHAHRRMLSQADTNSHAFARMHARTQQAATKQRSAGSPGSIAKDCDGAVESMLSCGRCDPLMAAFLTANAFLLKLREHGLGLHTGGVVRRLAVDADAACVYSSPTR